MPSPKSKAPPGSGQKPGKPSQKDEEPSSDREKKMRHTGEVDAANALASLIGGGSESGGNGNANGAAAELPTIADAPKNFPQMLMEILNDKENEDSISWLPHGRSFRINKRETFLNEVLPRYYEKTVKYASFTRKLSRWDFVRLSSGPDAGAFHHKLFQRDNPKLVKRMFCKGERPGFCKEEGPGFLRPTMPPHGHFMYRQPLPPGAMYPPMAPMPHPQAGMYPMPMQPMYAPSFAADGMPSMPPLPGSGGGMMPGGGMMMPGGGMPEPGMMPPGGGMPEPGMMPGGMVGPGMMPGGGMPGPGGGGMMPSPQYQGGPPPGSMREPQGSGKPEEI